MGVSRILDHILTDDIDRVVGRNLIQLITECGTVKTVYPEERRLLGERAAWEIRYELREIGLSRVIVLEAVIAQSPIVLDSVVTISSAGQDRERLKQLRGLAVLPMIEITERGGIFRIHITSIQKSLVLRLARLERQYGKKGDRHKLQICL